MSNDNSNDKTLSLSEIEKKLQDAMEAVEILKKGGNITIGQESISKKYDELKKQFDKKSADYTELDEQFQLLTQEALELRQEKMMFEQFTNMTETEKDKMEKTRDEMKSKYETERQSVLETEQEKMFMEKSLEIETKEKEKAKTKYYKAIIVSVLAIAVVAGGYSILFAELAGQQYQVAVEPQSTGYTIQNLKGDTIQTYLSWRLVQGDTIRVNVLNADKYDPKILEVITKTILSEKELEIDNSFLHKGPKGTTTIMYEGWTGALKAAAVTETSLYVPVNFEVIQSKSGEGDITIELTNAANADGFAGWTNSIADSSQNQILKSRITIFSVDSMSTAAIETVIRHELGHALGLAHSTAVEDLMHPTIETNFPYISDCDVDAMVGLYDGGNTSDVICES
jgi:hypothetical protein